MSSKKEITIEQEHEEFEKDLMKIHEFRNVNPKRLDSGYLEDGVQSRWEGWMAAKKSLVPNEFDVLVSKVAHMAICTDYNHVPFQRLTQKEAGIIAKILIDKKNA